MRVELVPIVAIAGGFIVAICCTAIYYAHLSWKVWQETALKRDLAGRGYTAQEIIAIIGAEPGTNIGLQLPNVPPAKAMQQRAY